MITYLNFKRLNQFESADNFLLSPGGARLSLALTRFTSEFEKGSGGAKLLCSSAETIILSLINMSTKNKSFIQLYFIHTQIVKKFRNISIPYSVR